LRFGKAQLSLQLCQLYPGFGLPFSEEATTLPKQHRLLPQLINCCPAFTLILMNTLRQQHTASADCRDQVQAVTILTMSTFGSGALVACMGGFTLPERHHQHLSSACFGPAWGVPAASVRSESLAAAVEPCPQRAQTICPSIRVRRPCFALHVRR
jgi:hypothetical protein